MSNHNNHYRDRNFSLDQVNSYTLLLNIGTASFSYAIVDQNRLIAFHENCEIDELIEPQTLDYILKSTYKNIVIGLPSNGFTLLPANLSQPDQIANFARLLDLKNNEKVFSQPLDDLNQIIYKVDEKIINTITVNFDLKDCVFGKKGWINAITNSKPSPQNLYLNIELDKVELLYIFEDKLRFYNTFEFKNADELVYFTSLVASELQLDPHNITLVLSGNVNAGDRNTSRLSQFFAGLIFNKMAILEMPDQIKSYKILTLAALSLCGSSEVV